MKADLGIGTKVRCEALFYCFFLRWALLPARRARKRLRPRHLLSPSASPAETEPTSNAQLVNGLSAADLQAAFGLIKSNFAQPEVINETELNRATFQGLMARLGHGLMVVPDKASVPAPTTTPFYGEILDEHIGYVRPGSLQNASLQLLDKKLVEFSSKKIDGLIIDLRSSATDDFAMAAEFAKRFCARGKTLFTVQKAGKNQKTFVSDRDPTFQRTDSRPDR